jgi:hypothetical protein
LFHAGMKDAGDVRKSALYVVRACAR